MAPAANRIRRGAFCALPLALTWVLPLRASAQRSESGDIWEFFEEEARVVGAAKHAQSLSDAPATAQVITARDIALYGYRTLAEALRSVPGIYGASDRNYTYLWVRGFGRPSDYNDRILLLINGHRINENIYGSNSPGFDFSLDVNSIDHIEVVKGPGSALYGDNAFFAVINVVTRTAKTAPAARARIDAGSYGTHKEFAEAAHKYPNGWELYASGFYRYMKGQDLVYPEFSGINGGKAVEADREESAALYMSLSRPGWLLQGNLSGRNKRVPTASFGTRFNDNGTYTTDGRSFLELAADQELTGEIRTVGRVYYDWYGYHGNYLYDNATPPPARLVNKDFAKSSWYGEEWRWQFTPFGPLNALTAGEEFEKNLLGRQGNYYEGAPALGVFDDNRTEYRWALFGQQELAPLPSLGLTLGARDDYYQAFGHTFNPRMALVYHPWESGSAKLLYGSAFRAPNLFERFYTASGNLANPGLKPETIRTFEAAFEQRLGLQDSVSASYFQNRIKNLIDETTNLDGSIQYKNQDAAIRTDGLELYCKGQWRGGVSGHLGYTLQATRRMGGDRLSNSPTHTGNIGLSKGLPFWRSSISAESYWLSKRRTFQNTDLPATAVLSLNLNAQPWRDGPKVYVGVYNLFDTDYRVSGAAEHVQAAIPQDGRNFTAGLEYRFGDSIPYP